MRLTGKIRTLRGTVTFPTRGGGDPINAAKRMLVLDDGRINVGYKIVEFQIFNSSMTGASQAFASQAHLALSLEPQADALPAAEDNREIAWASYNTGTGFTLGQFSLVDPDHIVVRDLQIVFPAVDNLAEATVNYYIQMEEYDISDTEAIISIIKEESQDVFN